MCEAEVSRSRFNEGWQRSAGKWAHEDAATYAVITTGTSC